MRDIKTILVANNHLKRVGGTETFTYAVIKQLLAQGFEVEYFTFFKGVVSDKIEKDLGINFMSKSHYDLILASHNTCVNFLSKRGITIQISHGIFPKEEQPTTYADGIISISEEVKTHIENLGLSSKLVLNGIDCERYFPKKPLNKNLTSVLSLSQSEIANTKIKEACDRLQLKFNKLNKNENPVWHVEDLINQADLVIGLGRSAYEAMACGRTVVVYDERDYNASKADGYMTPELVLKCVKNNCSGRYFNYQFDTEDIINCFKQYNKNDGDALRLLVLEYFNIEKMVHEYVDYASSLSKTNNAFKLFWVSLYQRYRMNKRIRKQKRKGIL
jgi:glycosyltransferase involved in cell wall biosynthesis